MYQSVIDGNGEQKYSFTPLAEIVDRFSINYDNVERYPNPLKQNLHFSAPQPRLPGMVEFVEASVDEIDAMFK